MGRPWLSGAEQKKANCISDGRAYNSRKGRYSSFSSGLHVSLTR